MLREGLETFRSGMRDLAQEASDLTRQSVQELRDAAHATSEDMRAAFPSFDEVLDRVTLLPGVRVGREEFLADALRRQPAHVVRRAIGLTPAKAGISARRLSRLAGKALGREARRTLALSVAAGLPGAAAAAATIPADLVQFYGHLIRGIQMLTYLYGWRDTCRMGEGSMDVPTRRAYVLFLGAMAGDERADAALARLAPLRDEDGVLEALASGGQTDEVARALQERMAHRLAGQAVGMAVPLAGAVVSGTMSYGGFSDMWKRLRSVLADIG